ncbi:MAG: hypothetical protein KatS3mg015_2879 [Fimbriimonadales bacterium]|jgi:hypothetical protein|nr:MAG: hypothetical protein KatS3mg015_2879 [Fimbriimonadales bacterium]
MANPYISTWMRARTAAQAGRQAAPEQYLTSNPFYVGPAGSPVPRWVKDPLGRTGRTPAFPDPASVPPDTEVITKPVWYPEPASGLGPGVEPTRTIPSPTGDPNLGGVIRDGGSGAVSPEDIQRMLEQIRIQQAAGITTVEPGNWWPRNPSPATQPPQGVSPGQAGPRNPMLDWYGAQRATETVKGLLRGVPPGSTPTAQAAPAPASNPAPSATAKPTTAAAVQRSGFTKSRTGGVVEPVRRKPVTMSQAYTEAQQRLQNRTPFSSRLG